MQLIGVRDVYNTTGLSGELMGLSTVSSTCDYIVTSNQLHVTLSYFLPPLPRDELPEAAYMHQLLGLNLLFLLSQNRVSEFHTELERLSAKDIQTNVYIRHPVSLEQVPCCLHVTLSWLQKNTESCTTWFTKKTTTPGQSAE